jgi:large subunit ribosomal protein L3
VLSAVRNDIEAMSKGLIGRKLGMIGFFSQEGKHIPVTVVELGPCVVTQIKTVAKEKYNALQVGFGDKSSKRVNKPLAGHLKKSGERLFAHLKEFPVDDPGQYELGQAITLEIFEIGEKIDVTGMMKGRGFAGVIKRHGFHGGKKTHGSKSHRIPGSIGCSATPSKVVKGKKLPGHYGNSRKTIKNLEVIDIRPEDNMILIKGAIPGPNKGIVVINKREKSTVK